MMNATTSKLRFPVGIEIETSKARGLTNRMLPPEYELGVDGTVGWEARSIKLEDPTVLIESTTKTCRAMKSAGCDIHHKCGLHVHIGFKQVGDLSAKYRLFRFMSCYEDLFFQIMPPWSERISYCKKLPAQAWESFKQGNGFNYWLGEDGEAYDRVNRRSRYWWLNGEAMFKHGTVEFRHMNGTLEPGEIIGWVATLQCIFHATTNLDVKLDWLNRSRITPATLLRDMKVDSNETWGERAKQFIESKASQL